MTTTLDALLSRQIPSDIAQNLVAKKETLTSLAQRSDVELADLQLTPKHIAAIRDQGRPKIPSTTLHKVLEESWRTCCVCHKPGRAFVVHHIEYFGAGGSHDETNLAVLCLDDHNEAHLSKGLSARLSADTIRRAKKNWISRAASIRSVHEKRLLSPYHRSKRWYWIHFYNLLTKTSAAESLGSNLSDEHLATLRDKGFIDSEGHINPESMWQETLAKPHKTYLFDSANAQLMATYVSDLLCRFIENSAVFDITGMLSDKPALQNYLSVGALVFFRNQLEIKETGTFVVATIYKTDIRIEIAFDRWSALNQTSHGIHLRTDMAERSVVGEISSIVLHGDQLRIHISPLGISPDFVLHDPARGEWVKGANNSDFRSRTKSAKE